MTNGREVKQLLKKSVDFVLCHHGEKMGSLSSLLAISSKMIKRLTTFTILLWLLPALLQAAVTRDPYQYFFQPSLGDLTEELEIAREEGKQGIFIFFEMDECPFCHRMKETVLNQPDVQAYFAERFHSLSMDIEGDIEIVVACFRYDLV